MCGCDEPIRGSQAFCCPFRRKSARGVGWTQGIVGAVGGYRWVVESFEELVARAESADVSGWDFSWLDGRATEERPPWRYSRLLAERLATATASLDVQTGGGEVLAEATTFPPTAVATESWPPNIAKATQLLHPRGVVVVADPDEPPLPF